MGSHPPLAFEIGEEAVPGEHGGQEGGVPGVDLAPAVVAEEAPAPRQGLHEVRLGPPLDRPCAVGVRVVKEVIDDAVHFPPLGGDLDDPAGAPRLEVVHVPPEELAPVVAHQGADQAAPDGDPLHLKDDM